MTASAAANPPPDGFSPLAEMRWIDCADHDDLLLALLAAPAVVAILGACRVDANRLRDEANARVARRHPSKLWASFAMIGSKVWRPPGADADREAVDRVLTRAMLRAGSSDGRVASAGDVLVALLDDTASAMPERLRRAGLTRYDALRFVCHGLAKGETDPDLTDGDGPFRVLLLNDSFTPMDAVVAVLTDLFGLPRDAALRTMRDVHEMGSATIGVYDRDTARAKLEAVSRFGRDHQFPLRCVLEPSKPETRGAHAELLT